MDFNTFWVVVFFVLCYEQSSIANNVNALDKNHLGRSRPKKSVNSEIYLALPPENTKTGKQNNNPPTLIRLDPNAPNRFKGKFPTPIERFIQRIQNYFSVYNPPEYLNELRPGINNSEEDSGDQADYSNETQIIFPCNGTSTIVIIPVALEESENVPNEQNTKPEKPNAYGAPPASKPNHLDYGVQTPAPYPDPTTPKQNYLDTVTTPKPTTPKPKCPEVTTTPTPPPCPEETTTPKPKCPEVTTTPTPPPCPEETTTPKPKCPEVTTTPTPPPCPEETTTPKPKCPEVTTPKPKCPEVTTPTPNPCAEETTTPKPKCPGQTAQNPLSSTRHNTTSGDFKPVSGYGPNEVPPLNLVARPAIGSTVVYFYKNPSTPPPHPAAYYMPSTQTPYEVPTRRPQPPILRLKQLLFPRLYAAFHGED